MIVRSDQYDMEEVGNCKTPCQEFPMQRAVVVLTICDFPLFQTWWRLLTASIITYPTFLVTRYNHTSNQEFSSLSEEVESLPRFDTKRNFIITNAARCNIKYSFVMYISITFTSQMCDDAINLDGPDKSTCLCLFCLDDDSDTTTGLFSSGSGLSKA